MEECSVLIETTKSAEDKTSRWFDLPIDYELFRDLLGVEADSGDYQIIDMKLPFAGDIVRTTSVRRLNKLYFAYTDLSPEVQLAYKELISYCGGVEDLLQKSEELDCCFSLCNSFIFHYLFLSFLSFDALCSYFCNFLLPTHYQASRATRSVLLVHV